MSKFKTVIQNTVYSDIKEIVDYFNKYSKTGAHRIRKKIITAISRVKEQPYIGVVVSDEELSGFEFRKVIVENYLIFYRIFENENKIVIYRVLDGRRNYPSLLNQD